MKVTYNGFTGELVKLERKEFECRGAVRVNLYDLSIYDDKNKCIHSFTGANLEDIKLSGGVMIFGG